MSASADDLDVGAALLGGHERLGRRRDVPAEHRDPQRVARARGVEDVDEVPDHRGVAAAVGRRRGEADFVRRGGVAAADLRLRRGPGWERPPRAGVGRRTAEVAAVSGAGCRVAAPRHRSRRRRWRPRARGRRVRTSRGACACRPASHPRLRAGDYRASDSACRRQPGQRLAGHGRVGGGPHRRQAGLEEAAVAGRGQPRVEHRDHAAVGRRPDQPAGALRQQQRGVGGGDLHEAVAAGLVGGPLPGAHQRVVGARERDPVDEHQLAGVAGHVEPLPEREGAEQRGVRVVDELPGQLGQLGVALGQRGQVRQPLADGLRRGLGGPPAGEEPERPALAGVDQLDDLVELGRPRARRGRAAAGGGRRRGSPAGRSRTGCRRRGRATGRTPSARSTPCSAG